MEERVKVNMYVYICNHDGCYPLVFLYLSHAPLKRGLNSLPNDKTLDVTKSKALILQTTK